MFDVCARYTQCSLEKNIHLISLHFTALCIQYYIVYVAIDHTYYKTTQYVP